MCQDTFSHPAQQKETNIVDDIGWKFTVTPYADHKLSQQGVKGRPSPQTISGFFFNKSCTGLFLAAKK